MWLCCCVTSLSQPSGAGDEGEETSAEYTEHSHLFHNHEDLQDGHDEYREEVEILMRLKVPKSVNSVSEHWC